MSSKKLSHYDQESIPNAEGLRFAIVVSEWNENITENLYKGAHKEKFIQKYQIAEKGT